jgi:hypothetical protein
MALKIQMSSQVVGKISELVNKTQESVSKANTFPSAEGFANSKGLIRKHTEQEDCSGFYP